VGSNGIATPVSDKIQDSVLGIRISSADKTALEKKAGKTGRSLSEWARDTLLEVPEFDPNTRSLREATLEEMLTNFLTEEAKQYKHFLSTAEQLFAPLAQQMANHREWMKGTLTGFSGDVTQQVGKVTAAIAQQDQQIAASLKEADRRFYARWIYVCLAAFLMSAVSGFALGYWRP
jgi:hypothetical protein